LKSLHGTGAYQAKSQSRNLLKVGSGAGAETNSFGSAALLKTNRTDPIQKLDDQTLQ
jgi:hypothetical protein